MLTVQNDQATATPAAIGAINKAAGPAIGANNTGTGSGIRAAISRATRTPPGPTDALAIQGGGPLAKKPPAPAPADREPRKRP